MQRDRRFRPSLLALLVVTAAALVLAPAGAVAGDHYGYTDRFDQTFAMSATGRVSLENINGDVTIEVWDRAEVRVVAEKMASSQELLDSLEVEVNAGPDSVQIETEYHRVSSLLGSDGHRKVEYTLTVPSQAAIKDIDLVNGDLLVSGVKGGVEAESVNGTIVAREISGNLDLSTVNGSIKPELADLAGADRIELESVNGTVELAVPAGIGASVKAETVNGKISNDFGLQVNKHKYVGADLRGDLNGGGVAITIETVNGNIKIVRQ